MCHDEVQTRERGSCLTRLAESDGHRHVGRVGSNMQDELRIVTLPKTVLASTLSNEAQQQQQQVLLGIGYMAWSGGIWNASPFVLWRA